MQQLAQIHAAMAAVRRLARSRDCLLTPSIQLLLAHCLALRLPQLDAVLMPRLPLTLLLREPLLQAGGFVLIMPQWYCSGVQTLGRCRAWVASAGSVQSCSSAVFLILAGRGRLVHHQGQPQMRYGQRCDLGPQLCKTHVQLK